MIVAGNESAMSEISEDAFLGGALRLRQLRQGHRAGHDAMLLAAAVPACAGERIADLGAGIGAAGLALAVRVADAQVALFEREADLVRLAQENIALNQCQARVAVHAKDVARLAGSAGAFAATFDQVMMNPPYHGADRHPASPDRLRAAAHVLADDGLGDWVGAATALLRPKGRLTLIWRADGLGEVLAALGARFGALDLWPVHARAARPAIRVLIGAVMGARAPLCLHPPLILQDEAGRPSPGAEAILRHGAVLPQR